MKQHTCNFVQGNYDDISDKLVELCPGSPTLGTMMERLWVYLTGDRADFVAAPYNQSKQGCCFEFNGYWILITKAGSPGPTREASK